MLILTDKGYKQIRTTSARWHGPTVAPAVATLWRLATLGYNDQVSVWNTTIHTAQTVHGRMLDEKPMEYRPLTYIGG